MKRYILGDLVKVNISGIDKKTKESERSVRLCNFTEVYYNWAITKNMYASLMRASASDNDINTFLLKKGQVAITKDSETREDIGVATYIADDFDDVVLGYHCALIIPREDIPEEERIYGKYLNAFLHTKYAQKYFSNNATGSGQRYTLSKESIEGMPVFLPSFKEQKRIGDYLSDIDRKIEINRLINAELEAMAKQIYDYWFVQFDFPDEEGKPYKSSGGKMVWNEVLKREIPEGWCIKSIKDISMTPNSGVTPSDTPNTLWCHYSIPAFDKYGTYHKEYGDEIDSGKIKVETGQILVSKLNPWFNRVILVDDAPNTICSTEFVVLNAEDDVKGFLYYTVKSEPFIQYCTQGSTGSSHSHRRINPDLLKAYSFPYNQEVVTKISESLLPIINNYWNNIKQRMILEELLDYKLPWLLSGILIIKD